MHCTFRRRRLHCRRPSTCWYRSHWRCRMSMRKPPSTLRGKSNDCSSSTTRTASWLRLMCCATRWWILAACMRCVPSSTTSTAPGPEKTWFFDRKLSGGGALLDLGVHLIDLAVWLLAPPAVTLELADLERRGVERAA